MTSPEEMVGGARPESKRSSLIRRALAAKGYEDIQIKWEAIGAGAEKGGPSGGWIVTFEPNPAPPGNLGQNWIGGYNYREVLEWIADDRMIPPRPLPWERDQSGGHPEGEPR